MKINRSEIWAKIAAADRRITETCKVMQKRALVTRHAIAHSHLFMQLADELIGGAGIWRRPE
jgi:hypothetical protein